jgi:hypothetical protein
MALTVKKWFQLVVGAAHVDEDLIGALDMKAMPYNLIQDLSVGLPLEDR